MQRKVIEDYADFSEVAGTKITRSQLHRMLHRYSWAVSRLKRTDKVLELCCGCGQGLSLLADNCLTIEAVDRTSTLVEMASLITAKNLRVYKQEVGDFLSRVKESTYDVIIMFECIYFFPDLEAVLKLCKISLNPGGRLLCCWPNPRYQGFTPCDHTYIYPTLDESIELLSMDGCKSKTIINGVLDSEGSSGIQDALFRTIKSIATSLKLIPKKQSSRQTLKRIFSGPLVTMPSSLSTLVSVDDLKEISELNQASCQVFYSTTELINH